MARRNCTVRQRRVQHLVVVAGQKHIGHHRCCWYACPFLHLVYPLTEDVPAGFNYHFDALKLEAGKNELNEAFNTIFDSLPALDTSYPARYGPLPSHIYL
jgi:hypothetical protein